MNYRRWVADSGPRWNGHTPKDVTFDKYNACANLDPQSLAFSRIAENWANYTVSDSTYKWVDELWSFKLQPGNIRYSCSERQAYEAEFDADMNAPASVENCKYGVLGHFRNIAHQDYIRVGCWYTEAFGTLCNYGSMAYINIYDPSTWELKPIQGANEEHYGERCSSCPRGTECAENICANPDLE
eukprot:Awhi_evm1s15196